MQPYFKKEKTICPSLGQGKVIIYKSRGEPFYGTEFEIFCCSAVLKTVQPNLFLWAFLFLNFKFNYEFVSLVGTHSVVSCSTRDNSTRDLCIMSLGQGRL